MNRRTFFLSLPACTLPGVLSAYQAEIYAPATWRDMKQAHPQIILNWRASWSLTCQIKETLLTDLLAENPAYSSLTFVDVDWDTFGQSQWAQRLKIERRSTLVALSGDTELARVVNEPYAHKLRNFLDAALNA